ncbi:MAG TPA: glycoside hydrolase family 3 N-terminal domain-containing protein [Hanamia sp.]|nr:glycoside hydrolase family 3 N-terminal domain-containing protein [Hanamia sp.]
MKRTRIYYLVIFILIVAFAQKNNSNKYPYQNPDLAINERVSDLLSRMTVMEKIKQLDMYKGVEVANMDGHNAVSYSEEKTAMSLDSTGVGSIHDFYPESVAIANKIQNYAMNHTRLGIPVLFIEEGLHGYNGKGSTYFPIPLELAGSWDSSLIHHIGRVIATEARSRGTDMLLSPVIGLARDPRWGRVEETYGEDPYLDACNAIAMVKGLQGDSLDDDNAVIAEPKHFAMHSIPEGGSNTSPVSIGEREARSSFLYPFEQAVQVGGAKGIMAAYSEDDGIPCIDNKWLLTDVLRKEWGFKGFVLSDLGAIKMTWEDHHVAANIDDAVAQALKAGVNMQFYDFSHKDFENAILDDLKNHSLTMSDLDKAVADVLRVKFMLGLFDHPYTDTSLSAKVYHTAKNQALALKAAQEGICLLKNDGHLLPLNKNVHSVAVIGPLAASTYMGDYVVPGEKGVSILDGLKQRAKNSLKINYAEGYSDDPSGNVQANLLQNAINTSRKCDLSIVVLGESEQVDGEGKDRADLNLDQRQMHLIQAIYGTGKPVVVVLLNGRPLTINWTAMHIPSIVEAWYAGEKGGLAVADVLLGKVNPSGKLPITFPRSTGQLPFYYDHKPTSLHRYVDEKNTPLFPFGLGLSYTTFQYSEMQINPGKITDTGKAIISVNIKNTGRVTGTEVAELYVRDVVSSVTTPLIALKGFERVTLKPGESSVVNFTIQAKQLSLWNRQMKQVVEPGEFKTMVGSSSGDIRQKGSLWVVKN